MPGGRPSDYNEEIAERVLDLIGSNPRGLDYLCSLHDDLPAPRTVHRWLAAHEEFRQRYVRARERQADLIFDECLEIADDSQGDRKFVGRDGEEREVCDTEFVQRAKLRIETRMRMAGKLAPKKYGDKVQTELSGPDGGPVSVTWLTPE